MRRSVRAVESELESEANQLHWSLFSIPSPFICFLFVVVVVVVVLVVVVVVDFTAKRFLRMFELPTLKKTESRERKRNVIFSFRFFFPVVVVVLFFCCSSTPLQCV